MNNKGATLSGWAEIAILSVLFIGLFSLVLTGMNDIHSKNYENPFDDDQGNLSEDYLNYQKDIERNINSSEPTLISDGLIIKSGWDMIKQGWKTASGFITGSWISNTIYYAQLPTILGTSLQTLWLLGLGFIIIKLLFKVVP